ncbi:MAG: SLBB domain-containing protein [Chitinivibrionia bacterium]|nr:SLBB domain-containing protein [Chitinivibrionia bacterium]
MRKIAIILSVICAVTQSFSQMGIGLGAVSGMSGGGYSPQPQISISSGFGTQMPSDALSNERTENKTLDLMGLYIDEDAYYPGSGDIFQAFVWGLRETVLNISVTGDEVCIIPTVGAVDISGSTLKETKEKIIALIKRKYKADRIDVFLAKIKDVTFQAQGKFNQQGTHTVRGDLSIQSIIDQIGGVSNDANLREVQLIHPKYGARIIDVVKSNRTVDYPIINLRNGDKIFVPKKDLQVIINGDVHYAGTYDFVAGDKLSDLISLSGGLFSSADSSRLVVTRFVGDKDSIVKITLPLEKAADFLLEKDDIVTVSRKAEYRQIRQVKVFGEVMFPGTYTIQENKTRLTDVIQMAGGLTEQAFLEGSKIVRRSFIDAGKTELKKLSAAKDGMQITPSENNFLKFNHTNETRVSVDFSQLKMDNNSIGNVILKENDEIYIEKKDWIINVMGGVVRPGLVDFVEGKNLNYYVSQAGGYKSGAIKKQTRIIKAATQTSLHPRDVDKIERGDAIWVPEDDYVQKQEKLQNVSITSGVLSIVGSIATVITAAITVISFVESRQ